MALFVGFEKVREDSREVEYAFGMSGVMSRRLTITKETGQAKPATWLIGQAAWVAYAIRAVEDEPTVSNMSVTHGLVVTRDGQVLYLNQVATMRALGARVGVDLDPIAYAEVLAELYSASLGDGEKAFPTSATPEFRSGELIDDVARFHATYDFVDPGLVAPPRTQRAGNGIVLDFFSCHYFVTPLRTIDIIRWSVTCKPGEPAVWQRDYVVKRLESR
ncbi:MAG TPA: hypothetical protein VH561_15955 [Micromonosporaceae bacterium]|jgi:hypothetical protein